MSPIDTPLRTSPALADDVHFVEVTATKDFDPRQPRDPHTGEWIDTPGTDVPSVPKVTLPELYKAMHPPDPGGPWEPGVFGKGFLDADGEPVDWQVKFPELSPHHDDMWGIGADHLIVIAPDGSWTPTDPGFEIDNTPPEEREAFEDQYEAFDHWAREFHRVDQAILDQWFAAYWEAAEKAELSFAKSAKSWKEFVESEHPRDRYGRWTDVPGSRGAIRSALDEMEVGSEIEMGGIHIRRDDDYRWSLRDADGKPIVPDFMDSEDWGINVAADELSNRLLPPEPEEPPEPEKLRGALLVPVGGEPSDSDYRIRHTAPGPQNNDFTADDMEAWAPDFYEHPEWYATGDDKMDRESLAVLFRIRGKPDAMVTIYRSTSVAEINDGDWVSLSRSYARLSNMDPTDPSKDLPVMRARVRARQIWWDGNSINEFGYSGPRLGLPGKRFDPKQPRDPHTGEWVDDPANGWDTGIFFHVTAAEPVDGYIQPRAEGSTFGIATEPDAVYLWPTRKGAEDHVKYVERARQAGRAEQGGKLRILRVHADVGQLEPDPEPFYNLLRNFQADEHRTPRKMELGWEALDEARHYPDPVNQIEGETLREYLRRLDVSVWSATSPSDATPEHLQADPWIEAREALAAMPVELRRDVARVFSEQGLAVLARGPRPVVEDDETKEFDPHQPRDRRGRWAEVPGDGPLGGTIHVEAYHVSMTGEPPGTHADWVHVGDEGAASQRELSIYNQLGEGGEAADVVRELILHGQPAKPRTYHVSVDGPALNGRSRADLVSDDFANVVTAGKKWVTADEAEQQGFSDLLQTPDGYVQIPMSEAERFDAAEEVIVRHETWPNETHHRHYVAPERLVLDQLRRGLTGAIFYDNYYEQSWEPSIVAPAGQITVLDSKDFDPHQERWPEGTPGGLGGQWRGEDIPLTDNWLGQPIHFSELHRDDEDPPPIMGLITIGRPDMVGEGDDKLRQHITPDGYGALGRLLTPQQYDAAKATEDAGVPFACDNDGFEGVDEDAYRKMLQKMVDSGVHPAWVTVPDVLIHNDDGTTTGDADATIKRFEQWKQYLDSLGLPAAFVAQDGMEKPENMQWLRDHIDEIDCVFIGGGSDDNFKLGPTAVKIAQLAHAHGKLVHMGRVNSDMRVAYARDVMHADSFDGSNYAKQKDTNLPGALEMAQGGDAPPTETGKEWVSAAVRALATGGKWPHAPGRGKPQWPRGFYATAKAAPAKGILYYEPLVEVTYIVGLSDYVHLYTDDGVALDYQDDKQLAAFIRLLGLPEPDSQTATSSKADPKVTKRAAWSAVELAFDDPPYAEPYDPAEGPATKDFDPHQPRDRRGRWTETPGGGSEIGQRVGGSLPASPAPGSGDGYVTTSDGETRWGRFGGAGLLYRHVDADGTARYLVQHRGSGTVESDTWSIPGGARDEGESALNAAVRESGEELGGVPDGTVARLFVDRPVPEWSYTTYVVDADRREQPTVRGWETRDLRWVTETELRGLPLHSGFRRAVEGGILGGAKALKYDPNQPRDPLGRWVEDPDTGGGLFDGFSPFDELGNAGMRQALVSRGHTPRAIGQAERIMDRWNHAEEEVKFDIVGHLNRDTPTGRVLRDRIGLETAAARRAVKEHPRMRLYRMGSLDEPMLSTSTSSEGGHSVEITGRSPRFTPDHSAALADLLDRYDVLGGFHYQPGYVGEEEVALIDRRIVKGQARVQRRPKQKWGRFKGLRVPKAEVADKRILDLGDLSAGDSSEADALDEAQRILKLITYQRPGDNAPSVEPGVSYFALGRGGPDEKYTTDDVLDQMEVIRPDLDREAARVALIRASTAADRAEAINEDFVDPDAVMLDLLGYDVVSYVDRDGKRLYELLAAPFDPRAGEREIVFDGSKDFDPLQPRDERGRWTEIPGWQHPGDLADLPISVEGYDPRATDPAARSTLGRDAKIGKRAEKAVRRVPEPIRRRLAHHGVTVRISRDHIPGPFPADGGYDVANGKIMYDTTSAQWSLNKPEYVVTHELGHAVDLRWDDDYRTGQDAVDHAFEGPISSNPPWPQLFAEMQKEKGPEVGLEKFADNPTEWFATVFAATVLNRKHRRVTKAGRAAMEDLIDRLAIEEDERGS